MPRIRLPTGFGLFYCSFAVSALGDAFRVLAVTVWIFEASAGSLGERLLLVLLANVPGMLLGGVSGVLADRYDKFVLLVGADVIRVVIGLGLVWSVQQSSTTAALVLVGIGNAAGVFFSTSSFALIPRLVSKEKLPRANGLMETGQWIVQVVGPSLAAITLATAGAGVAFLLDSASFVVSGAILFCLRRSLRGHQSSVSSAVRAGYWADFREGVGIIWRDHAIRSLLGASYGVAFLTACTSFALIFLISDTLGASTEALGFVYSLNGLVAVGAAAATAALLSNRRLGPVMAASISGLCVAQLVIGLAPDIWVLGVGVVISAAANAPYNVAVSSLYMTRVPERFLGRVEGVDTMIDNTVSVLGYGAALVVMSLADARLVFVMSTVAALPSLLIAWLRVARREPTNQ